MATTILLVEDDEITREITADALAMLDVQVVACPSADDTFSILEQERRVDLVLTDIRMPGQLDGLQLAKIVSERWPAMPVVVTSGNILSGDVLPPQAMFLPKPWTLDALFQTVSPLLVEGN